MIQVVGYLVAAIIFFSAGYILAGYEAHVRETAIEAALDKQKVEYLGWQEPPHLVQEQSPFPDEFEERLKEDGRATAFLKRSPQANTEYTGG